HVVVEAQEIAGMTEAARGAVGAFGEVLKEVEGVPDHPARLGGGVMLANARRALASPAGCDRALVHHDHVADAASREMERGAHSGHAAAYDHHGCLAGRRHLRYPSISRRLWHTGWVCAS